MPNTVTVRMPDGTIVENVPLGTTRSELLRKLGQYAGPGEVAMRAGAGVDPNVTGATQAHEEAEAIQRENISPVQRFTEHSEEHGGPILAGLATLITKNPGWMGLLKQSALAGGGGFAGNVASQKIGTHFQQPADLGEAAEEGALSAGGNLVGGAILKGLGAAAKKIFSSPLDSPQAAASEFARTRNAPFPLSSAAPGMPAARVQQSTRLLLGGELRTQVDANKVAQFINKEVSTITDKASPIDEAALKGQQYLRQVFEPGETIYTQTFQRVRAAIGDETAVPLTNTTAALAKASQALKERGEMKAVYNRIRNILKADTQSLTVAELDELYSGVLKDTARNANARREANSILQGIANDIDVLAAPRGVSFADDLAKAKKVRDEFRGLRAIPGLERLGKEFGERGGTLGTRQWMSELFGNPNGKALAELRARNPELYHELADSWLGSNINRFSRPSDSAISRVFDGEKFRAWYEQNASSLKVIYGTDAAKALDNFSLYAKYMTGAVNRAKTGVRPPAELLIRGSAELAGAVKTGTVPLLALGESGAYVLAKGLADPSSTLFRLFTKGFSKEMRSFMVTSAGLSGQATARQSGD